MTDALLAQRRDGETVDLTVLWLAVHEYALEEADVDDPGDLLLLGLVLGIACAHWEPAVAAGIRSHFEVLASSEAAQVGVSTTPEQIEVMEHAVLDELIEQAVT